MADILIRSVGDDVVAIIDASAKRVGLSRSEYLRRVLDRERQQGFRPVSVDQLKQMAELTIDVDDPEVMCRSGHDRLLADKSPMVDLSGGQRNGMGSIQGQNARSDRTVTRLSSLPADPVPITAAARRHRLREPWST